MRYIVALTVSTVLTCACLHAQKQGQSLIDSILPVLQKANEDTNKLRLLNDLSFSYYTINPDLGIQYGNQELILADKLKSQKGLAMANSSIATNYHYKSDHKQALAYYAEALRINERNHFRAATATTMMNIGTVNWRLGDYPKALDNYFKAFKIHDSLGNKDYVAAISFNIGNVYLEQGDYTRALPQYLQSLKAFEATGDKMSAATVTGNIGNVYYLQKDNIHALEYFQRALTIHESIGNNSGIALMTGNIGSVYISLEQYAQGLNYLFKSGKAHEALGDTAGIAINYTEIGEAYTLLAKKGTAIAPGVANGIPAGKAARLLLADNYLKKAVAINRHIGDLNSLQQSLERLAEAQEAAGNFGLALTTFRESTSLKDSIFSKENFRKSVELKDKYYADRQLDSSKAENDKRFAVAAEKHRSLILLGTGTAVGMIALIIAGFFVRRRRERDQYDIQILELKQEALNAQMSDHFIGNTMDSINGFIVANDRENASRYLILFSRLIRRVLENATRKMVTVEEDLEVLRDYIALEKLRFAGDLQYEVQNPDDLDLDGILIPPMIFQTLAENAIKHGFNKATCGRLLITLNKKSNLIECVVEDNGVGRSAAMKTKNDNDGPTRKSFGTGIAEKLISTGNKYLKDDTYKITDLWNQHNEPAGTRVTFLLPFIPVV